MEDCGKGRLCLQAFAPLVHNQGAERFPADRKQSLLDAKVTPANLLFGRLPGSEEFECPTFSLEVGDDRASA